MAILAKCYWIWNEWYKNKQRSDTHTSEKKLSHTQLNSRVDVWILVGMSRQPQVKLPTPEPCHWDQSLHSSTGWEETQQRDNHCQRNEERQRQLGARAALHCTTEANSIIIATILLPVCNGFSSFHNTRKRRNINLNLSCTTRPNVH